jgi:hypothetical protein
MLVIDKENYDVVINLQNRELTPEELKKAATAKPLLQSKCKPLLSDIDIISWKVILI